MPYCEYRLSSSETGTAVKAQADDILHTFIKGGVVALRSGNEPGCKVGIESSDPDISPLCVYKKKAQILVILLEEKKGYFLYPMQHLHRLHLQKLHLEVEISLSNLLVPIPGAG